MNNNNTAVEKEKTGKVFELNEKYKDCPQRTFVQEVDGRTYRVHSHFIGDKDLDEIISRLAFEQALRDNNLST